MSKTRIEFLTPLGRFVQGDLFKASDKDHQGNPRVYKAGHPKAGQPNPQYFVALAIPKTSPDLQAFLAQLWQVARDGFPNYFDRATGNPLRNIAIKISDGDGVDHYGKPNSAKEGWAGCMVIKLTTQFPIKVYRTGQFTEDKRIDTDSTRHHEVKRGDWIRVSGCLQANGDMQNPGIFVNPEMAEHCYSGDAILGGADPAATFAAPVASLPMGATALPPAGSVPMPPPAAVQMPGVVPGMMPPPAAAPGMVPGMAPQPGMMPGAQLPPPTPAAQPAVVPGQHTAYMAPPAGMMPPPAAAPGMVPGMMPGAQLPPPVPAPVAQTLVPTAAANGHTIESLRAMGMTDDMMIARGYAILQ